MMVPVYILVVLGKNALKIKCSIIVFDVFNMGSEIQKGHLFVQVAYKHVPVHRFVFQLHHSILSMGAGSRTKKS